MKSELNTSFHILIKQTEEGICTRQWSRIWTKWM